MGFKVGDQVIYFKRENGSVYGRVKKLAGTVIKIGKTTVTCDCGVAGRFRALAENVQRVAGAQ